MPGPVPMTTAQAFGADIVSVERVEFDDCREYSNLCASLWSLLIAGLEVLVAVIIQINQLLDHKFTIVGKIGEEKYSTTPHSTE